MSATQLKNLFRILAVDDGSFRPREKGRAILIGVVSRVDGRVEGILSTDVEVDGLDSTERIAAMLGESKFKQQVKFLILDGLNFAGFNLVDLPKLSRRLGIPCIAVQRKRPRLEKIRAALSGFRDKPKRLQLIEKAGPVKKAGSVFFQASGGEAKEIKTVLSKTTKHGNLPEPLRLAHLVASGVSRGESTRP